MTLSPDRVGDEALYAALQHDDAEALYEHAPVGFLSTAPDGTILKANQTLLRLTGYGYDDLVGCRRFTDLLTPGGRIYHETHYGPLLHMQGSAREMAFDLVRADGSRLPALVNSVLERSPSGEPLVIRTAVFDATERRQYEEELLRAKRRAEESERRAVELARTIQQVLIPPVPPAIPDLDVATAYRPAGAGDEVGGDFYDVFEVAADDWVIALGDVSGKGVPAAVITALARSTLRAAALRQPSPTEMLETLNEVLRHEGSDRFCTVVLLRLRRQPAGWVATLASGGHPLPVLHRPGRAAEEVGRHGTLIGMLPSPHLHELTLPLGPGDTLLLYTDGVTEARRDGELFGEARLLATVDRHAGGGAGVLVDGVLHEVLEYGGSLTSDDIALVALHVP